MLRLGGGKHGVDSRKSRAHGQAVGDGFDAEGAVGSGIPGGHHHTLEKGAKYVQLMSQKRTAAVRVERLVAPEAPPGAPGEDPGGHGEGHGPQHSAGED